MIKLLTIIKWKILRYLVKKRKIGFRKCMLRMYYIQELEKLNQYNRDTLSKSSYKKLRKFFIKEFPNAHIHNPKTD